MCTCSARLLHFLAFYDQTFILSYLPGCAWLFDIIFIACLLTAFRPFHTVGLLLETSTVPHRLPWHWHFRIPSLRHQFVAFCCLLFFALHFLSPQPRLYFLFLLHKVFPLTLTSITEAISPCGGSPSMLKSSLTQSLQWFPLSLE